MDQLSLSNITKIYANGVLANDRVNFGLRQGEMHAIAGENGAGKSTLMKILYGLERSDGGSIHLNGKPIAIHTPLDALKFNIGMVHQHFLLVDEMTVCENIFLGIEKTRKLFLDQKEMLRLTAELGEKYNMKVDPGALCGSLPVGAAQKVEILKVLARGARILILDEPTAVLTPQETSELFAQLALLKRDGFSCIIITHKLNEIMQYCDRVTIMRSGRDCGTFDVASVTREKISRLMVGRDLQLQLDKKPVTPGEQVLKVSHLTVTRKNGTKAVDDISFSVRASEILGFAGVEGNGQREVVQCITGTNKDYSGSITLLGQDLSGSKVGDIRNLGLSHIPEDRIKIGVNPSASILDNLISTCVDQESCLGVIRYRKLREKAKKQIGRYGIKTTDISQSMDSLSGGNMQKVVIAREIEAGKQLLVADQPTRGVDVGAMEFIHNLLIDLRQAARAILLISVDISEIMNLADRIIVFHNGRITAHITDIRNLTDEQLGRYMLGIDTMKDTQDI